MKISYSSILVVLLVIVALAVSGCSGGSTTTNPTATPNAGASTGPTDTPAASTTPTGTPSSSADTLGGLYDMSKFSWFEYRATMTEDDMTTISSVKTEFLGKGVDPQDGKTKDHTRISTTMTVDGQSMAPMVMDFYSDPDASGSGSQSADPSTSDAKLTYVGSETITVPAGTFACMKYTAEMEGGSNMYWVSSQCPLPVQYTATVEGVTQTVQLAGYGK